jgi:hypothetical protein
MKEIVVIPTFARPELLALTLEKLDEAVDAPDDVHIYLDASPEKRVEEVERVRDWFLPRAQIFHAKPHIKTPSGTWNILNAIKSGSETGADLCWMIEEDVLIYPKQFFSWHRSQTAPASCGRYHYDTRWKFRDLYTNPGSCLRRPLLDALVPHICDEYFSDTRGYLDRTFGPWHEITHLDDGLVRNVMKVNGWLPAYPEKPVCAHIGFRGYASLDIYQNNETDLLKRIKRAEELISDPPQQQMWAPDWEPYRP